MRVLLGILLSLMIHFFFAWSTQFAPLVAPSHDNERVEIELLEEDKSQFETQKQIVRDVQLPDDIQAVDTSEDPLSFLSARDQRVKKQTRAPDSGLTQNRSNEAWPEQATEPQAAQEKQKTNQDGIDSDHSNGLDAFTPKYRKTPTATQQEADLDKGFSTIGEALPSEVAVGSFTALNTDRFEYYSFFARIEELIRFRWESSVRSAIDYSMPERMVYNPSGKWVTHVEVWIKSDGELHSTHVMKESGFKAFDRAAVQAFRQARMFPNPPQEMLESDGLIHLKYAFQVLYEPKVLVKSSD